LATVPCGQGFADTDSAGKIYEVFDIYRAGDKIGTNSVEIQREPDRVSVNMSTDIHVKILSFEAYHYKHICQETWKKNELISFHSETDDNGKKHKIIAVVEPDKVNLTIDGKPSEAPKTLVPASFWRKDIVNRKELFDPASGTRFSIQVKDFGEEPLKMEGADHQTHHFRISDKAGDYERDLWFDGDKLVRIKMIARDHSEVVSDLRGSSLLPAASK
jgi:hypothetical protein